MKINVFVSNLAKYNDGELNGQWTTLPVDDVNKDILDKIDLGKYPTGYRDEWFISDYEAPFTIDEYADLYQLNELAKALEDYDTLEDVFDAIDDKASLYLPDFVTDSLEELIEVSGADPVEAARATYFGKIQNWGDDYFFINEVGNFESMSDYQYQKMLKDNADEIFKQFKKENI
ncbi:antirestriction protein ArdA [Limosilactobacillus reuteri]|uniref:antirestriction protein ArdA n=1 Tax=Limosilactobacillus reuteri TaxID=1598 RepID=UPI000A2DFF17|nr:antirestriction protein ArdA [Limosilactobacillus reuteri]OTA85940.1 hypothetical protein BHL84_08480 [Limosilactobacillus reuteri]